MERKYKIFLKEYNNIFKIYAYILLISERTEGEER